jgi:hypothetical protein
VARIFKDGNNGGYANDWLIADTRKNEIASLELGLKNVTLERKTDGYFVGSNFPINPKLASEETDFAVADKENSPNARHRRWEQLMAENKGNIDVTVAEKFLADHVDSVTGKTNPSERTLCGHFELSSRGSGAGGWQPAYGTAGAAQNKATDSSMTAKMQFAAAAGHACGMDFIAAKHLQQHPELAWEKSELRLSVDNDRSWKLTLGVVTDLRMAGKRERVIGTIRWIPNAPVPARMLTFFRR